MVFNVQCILTFKFWDKIMEKHIARLNSIPMLWVSGISLFISFIMEYLFPMMEISFTLFINPAWISLLISGTPLAYAAMTNLLQKRIKSSLLITIAMCAAVYIDDVFAAGEIAFIMAIGEWLEDRTVEKAKKGIEILLNLVPNTGRKISIKEGKELELITKAEDIQIGDILRILPGESFPADGTIIVGNTSIDQSIMTGESLPVDKKIGDEVYTGTINCFGSVDIKVTKSFANSSLQKMIKLVEDAEKSQGPTQRIVDKWAGYFVPIALAIAVVTYFVVGFVFNNIDDAIIRAVTVLVVFCPCALTLATPTSIMAAIGQATNNGVLIKSGEALERMGQVETICFDKTGTLTHGKLSVSNIEAYNCDKNKLISLTASVESRSEHPIAKAIMNYTKEHNVYLEEVQDFSMVVGKGVFAKIGDTTIYCGNEKIIKENAKLDMPPRVFELINKLQSEGKAIVIVADQSSILGLIGLNDSIKDSSALAVAKLNSIGIDRLVLLSGDNARSANFIANEVGIYEVQASLLPEDKVNAVQGFMSGNRQVCMVGDGVNDAAALKTASVGIAMGTMGSDIAIDAADIAIMSDDISKIPYIKKLSLATIYSIKFNITLSMVINFGAIILSVMGWLSPAMGALVHNAGSVLVVLNASRLYNKKIN